jgi:hypothetical protein
MDKIGYAFAQSGAGAVIQANAISVQAGADALDANSENFPQSGWFEDVYVELDAIAGGIVDGDLVLLKLSWTNTQDDRPITNLAQQAIEVTGTSGIAVFHLGVPYRFPPDAEANGKVRVWLRHNRVGGTATGTVRITHRTQTGR